MENRNNVTEFILLGLTENPKMQKVIFVMFLVIYIVSMTGNMLILLQSLAARCWGPLCTIFWPISPLLMSAIPLSTPLN
jgi:hypothetical protein